MFSHVVRASELPWDVATSVAPVNTADLIRCFFRVLEHRVHMVNVAMAVVFLLNVTAAHYPP